MSGPLRIAIDARLLSGQYGGVEQVIIGLAHGLSNLGDGDERYEFLALEGNEDWLVPYVSGPCSLVSVPRPAEPVTWKHRLVRAFPRVAAARRRVLGQRQEPERVLPVPVSDGFVEREGFDVIHFTKQDGFLTAVPSIYHPHDLQHVHLPEFFSETERQRRDLWYRALCDQAAVVTVTSKWGKRDLVDSFGMPADKIFVIPLAPALGAYEPVDSVASDAILAELGVSGPFAFYPAQTWPHKNHIRLIEAIARLRAEGVDASLVCSGRKNEHFAQIERTIEALGVGDAVRFVDFVEPAQLQVLYSRARCVMMPTLFEAAGGFGPIAEAFSVGTAVACSNVTSLPEQVGDAALLFDPLSVEAIADVLERLWTDDSLRTELAARGHERIRAYSWDRVARTFRAHYRRIAGRVLDATDTAFVAQDTEF